MNLTPFDAHFYFLKTLLSHFLLINYFLLFKNRIKTNIQKNLVSQRASMALIFKLQTTNQNHEHLGRSRPNVTSG
jgi:hypothetical protein